MRFVNRPRAMNELVLTAATAPTENGVAPPAKPDDEIALNHSNGDRRQLALDCQTDHLAACATEPTKLNDQTTCDHVIETPSRHSAHSNGDPTTCFVANCCDRPGGDCATGQLADWNALDQIGGGGDIETGSLLSETNPTTNDDDQQPTSSSAATAAAAVKTAEQRNSLGQLSAQSSDKRHRRRLLSQSSQSGSLIVRRFQKFDAAALSSAPAPDVKIGQRVAYKEYYGNEFGTIRWIGRVPQISPDWTVGVEFDNAIGEGDGSLNGRRYFIAKDCFAKFLPLDVVALVDQHVGRPEPGTMISVMSAAVRPGQMISIQRVSTVHVQHCFLNAPHQRPGAEFLAVNTRLHCQCPSCGPCAHVVKPPRTQRLLTPKNATHMCQFSTYTCCGMESSDEALCTYTGNKISSLPPPAHASYWPPVGNSWMEGSGYLSQLQAEQRKLMPEEYRLGAAPEDTLANALLRRSSSGRRRGRGDRRDGDEAEGGVVESSNRSGVGCDVENDSEAPLRARGSRSGSTGHAHHHHHHKHKHRHAFQARQPTGAGEPTAGPQQLANNNNDGPIYANLGQQEAVHMQSGPQQQQQQQPSKRPPDDKEADSKFNELGSSPSGARCQSDYATAAGARDVNGAEQQPDNKEASATQLDAAAAAADLLAGLGERSTASPVFDEAARPAVVQYRDSIENRYLFPTDDVIDSTLEADLETLSQARYGPFGQNRSSVSNCSSADSHGRRRRHRPNRPTAAARLRRAARKRWRGDDSNQSEKRPAAGRWIGRRRRKRRQRGRAGSGSASSSCGGGGGLGGGDWQRRRRPDRRRSSGETASRFGDQDDDQYDQVDGPSGRWKRRPGRTTPSNAILQGLRSLVVSCLSANEQPSAATTPTGNSDHNRHHRRNNNHRNNHCDHHRHRRNVDSPQDYATPADLDCCCSRPESATAAAAPFQHFFANQNGTNETGELQHRAEVLAGQLEQLNLGKASATAATFMGWAAHLHEPDQTVDANYYMNLDLAHSNQWRDRHQHQHHLPGLANAYECDNGFKLGEEAAHELGPASWHRPQSGAISQQQQQASELPARRQISSSSDCGFSSASQNSMNLTNNSTSSSNELPAAAELASSATRRQSNAEEQQKLVQIYRRLAAQLAKSAADEDSAASSDDLLRLKRALIEVHAESCSSCRTHDNSHRRKHERLATGQQPPPEIGPKSAHAVGREQAREPAGADKPASEPSSRAPSRGCDQFEESQRTLATTRPFELKLTLSFNPEPALVGNSEPERKQL